ncbi:MAG TPA: DNA adenine methylase [Candidatus Kapabacteria bacterium]|nr:DNA adenine methylase [Candidatus Kapabacteria bacterium]
MRLEIPARPALRYHGGKWKLAKWIISFFPEHRVYVEPFGGAASVLLQKPRSYAEVYNDLWDVVVNVFQVLRDPQKSEQLKTELELTPFARTEFNKAFGHRPRFSGDVDAARLAILRSFAGFGSASTNGDYATGFRSNSNRSGTTPAHDWVNYPEQLETFCARMRGVVIENREALELIPQHDTEQTLFYVDPPYPHETRNMNRGNSAYACEMTDDDHRRLADVLQGVKGTVLISGYACEMYDKELYPNWYREIKHTHGDGATDRTEILWMNRRLNSQEVLPFANQEQRCE